jgi:ribose-phosphate pyrophosphokinase
MEIKKYPDGSSYAVVHSQEDITFRVNSYEDLWNLNQTVDALNNLGIRPTVTLPNLIDAQADRRFNNNESFGLKLVCKFLNSMNADFKIFHPHNPEVVEALLDNVQIIDNSEFVSKVIKNIHVSDYKNAKVDRPTTIYAASNILDNLILMSTDAGGFKPLMKLCDKLGWKGETFSASKSRKYEDGKSKLIQVIDRQDFEGKDILIIDDICLYGGTFKGLSKMLRERNCGKLYLAVSHITIEHHPQDNVFEYFDKLFTTNSKYDEYTAENENREMLTPQNLEVINLF